MNLLNDLRVRLALWIGGPTVRLWKVEYEGHGMRRRMDDSARVLGFRDYAHFASHHEEPRGEVTDPERGEREAFTRASPDKQALVEKSVAIAKRCREILDEDSDRK